MDRAAQGSAPTEPESAIYCVVPRELSELFEPLARHFSGDSKVEVVMEQRRRRDRRRGKDRRQGGGPAAEAVERRLGRELEGRRFGERRAMLLPVEEQPALPPDLYGYADQLGFVRRVDGSRLDMDVARLKEMAAQWRDRCRDAEREATGLLRTLVGVADDLGGLRTWSPRRFMAVHRVQRTIERYHQRHPKGADAPASVQSSPRAASSSANQARRISTRSPRNGMPSASRSRR
jgi:hypothetical protein